MDRRAFLRGAAVGGGGLLVAGSLRGVASTPLPGVTTQGAARASRLFPASRTFVVHTDLHNHSILSGDAAGDPDRAYGQLRAGGLDVASLTEHSIMGKALGGLCGEDCRSFRGMEEPDWPRLGALADRANRDGSFVAVRGFEWTTGSLGHLNVWFSREWTDALTKNAVVTPRGATRFNEFGDVDLPQEVLDLFEAAPDTASMDLFYEWLANEPGRPVVGGGGDGLAGFNHPNNYGNFERFKFAAAVAERMVSCEALNGETDYFFHGVAAGDPWPLAAVLDAGWRVGFIGVSDEHGRTWGRPGLARGGLWVRDLSRAGVRAAMLERRMFATMEPGLRLDLVVAGGPMGGFADHRRGPARFELDIDRGPAWHGRPLVAQVIRPGGGPPSLAARIPFRVPTPGSRRVSFTLPLSVDDGTWVFLRITDPAKPAPKDAIAPFAADGAAVAYTSPVWLQPRGRRAAGPSALDALDALRADGSHHHHH